MTQEKIKQPEYFHMGINSAMLQTMGNEMYSSVARCLAEFVANAYDADASEVRITIDFDKVNAAKNEIRAKAREGLPEGRVSAVYDPLPKDIVLMIHDNGHGMSAEEIQTCFMIINRNRRINDAGSLENTRTESGKRMVMGRKGIGKLAGFGAAEHVKVTSKRSGEEYSTSFEMDYQEIMKVDDLSKVRFKASYRVEPDHQKCFTTVELSMLRCDSMRSSETTINDSLARTFCVLDQDFKIILNDNEVVEEQIDWEFTYPPNKDKGDMAKEWVVPNPQAPTHNFPIEYIVRFRARPDDYGADGLKKQKRSSLPAERRGARIYCHGRLSHGPSLLNLHSGVHNFHAQDYMECIVQADALDEYEHDCIVTSREGLNKDNPMVDALFEKVTKLMTKALAEHYKQRDKQISEDIEKDEFSHGVLSSIQFMGNKSQQAAKQILKIVGREHGLKSDTYKEMAPILLNAVNAGDVLAKLIELETDPKSISEIAHSMVELAHMQNSDLLKLYRGRTMAIKSLQTLHEDSLDVRKGKGYEKQLHTLLKNSPWLVNPECANYLTSNSSMGVICATLNKVLQIDDRGVLDETKESDNLRPDLVFLATNQPQPDDILVVELKSPGIELEIGHLNQLEKYIFLAEEYLESKFKKKVSVKGYLIGSKPKKATNSASKRHLLKKISDADPNSKIRILDILELITASKIIHQHGIEVFEAEENRLNEDLIGNTTQLFPA